MGLASGYIRGPFRRATGNAVETECRNIHFSLAATVFDFSDNTNAYV